VAGIIRRWMDQSLLDRLTAQTQELAGAGLFKRERVIASPQDPVIRLEDGREVLNFCANNYLGLAHHADIVAAAHAALDRYGYGMASVRFICGTQTVHRELERRLSAFLGTEDTILYSSCFDANGGLFETITGEEDAIISDALNHASIIDGIRLSKAKRLRYDNADLGQLEARLREAAGARARLVVTDGVFSMDGTIAPLPGICDLAGRFGATVVVDDSHSTGFMGAGGKGTHEHCGVMGRVDVLTGTLGKALGGASGGYVSGRAPIIAWLRQRSRPYLFSNSIAPVVAATTLAVLDLLESSAEPRRRLAANAAWFRTRLGAAGFNLVPGEHPIIPVMIGDAALAVRMADRLLELGVYAIGFSYPVVPMGKARIRTQMCASHTREMLEAAASAFEKAGRELGVIAQ
jgi:glycine C-acetyltransferase